MAIVEKACGFTAFASPPAASYRFVISMEAENMDILLEDLESKRQCKLPEKQISVIGTFIGKYGNDAVIKTLANAKQADDTSDVVKKLETELFTRWMKNRQLPESVFSTLKIQNEEDIVVHMGKFALVDDYITFLNGKTGQKESLLKVLTKGFGDQKKALSVLAEARKNSLTTKRATELETKLLLEKSSDQIALTGGLDALGKNLAQLDGYVSNLKTTYTNNDVSILKALLVKYDDATVANALEKTKNVEGAKGIATKIQNEQFQIWLKEGNLIEGVYKLLKLNEYGDKIMTSRAIGVLESYTAFFNREMGAEESFIKIVSKHFGGDSKFAIKLQGFKGVEDTSVKSTAAKVKVNTQLKLWLVSGKSGIDVLNALKLGDDVEQVLKNSKLELLSKYVDKFNKGKAPFQRISLLGTLAKKHGYDTVLKALASVKQADDTVVVTKLETDLFTRWMNKKLFPENIFSNLKIRDEEDMVLRIGKIGIVNNYITFFNGKADKKHNLLNVLKIGFHTQDNALSVLAMARKDPLTNKRATELETTVLLEDVGDQIAFLGGLDALGSNLAKLDDYVMRLKTKYGNNDVSILRTLLSKYNDATIAKALVNAKSVDKEGFATNLQTEQFQIWLKDGKSVDDVFKLLKLDTYGESIMLSRGLDALESYTTFFNHEKSAQESFITRISNYFGGDDKFSIELLGFKRLPSSSEKATELQNKLFQQWKGKGITAENVIDEIFKVKAITNRGILRSAKEFANFLEKGEANKVANAVSPTRS
ncbi:Avirulence (Avh) protein [Phytophthora megakarya]|uniref:Avirulence (Avh) protein n=1 Tax=Phytophthora megakarya TaxID=4795 RepID=A0A225W3Q7_9STRA|nr:Avirulence (Avh) protein [Phytophthora megakarya]